MTHHAEVINYDKTYGEHRADYGHGERSYKWIPTRYCDRCGPPRPLEMVAHEILSKTEVNILTRYCQCEYHLTPWFKIWKWCFADTKWWGCMRTSWKGYSQKIIDKTRAYIEEHDKVAFLELEQAAAEAAVEFKKSVHEGGRFCKVCDSLSLPEDNAPGPAPCKSCGMLGCEVCLIDDECHKCHTCENDECLCHYMYLMIQERHARKVQQAAAADSTDSTDPDGPTAENDRQL